MAYKGYKEVVLNDYEMAQFYEGKCDNPDLISLENEYVLLKNSNGDIVDKLICKSNELVPIKFKKLDGHYMGTIVPKNPQQQLAFDLLQDNESTVKVLTGRYGSGKTFLMVAHALHLIEKGEIDKIVWVRNNIEVKDTAPLGALPGSIYDKLLPFAMPIADHVGGMEGLTQLLENGRLEIVHLGHLRGRDIKNAVIISSEAENLTTGHVQLMIGRVGEGSQLWLDGDQKQTDKKTFDNDSGMARAIEKLRGNRLFGYVHLEKAERSETAQLADLLD